MDEHDETVAAYDAYPGWFDDRFGRHMRLYNLEHADAFRNALRGSLVLDAGAGPGHYAARFVSQGAEVICMDPSEAMCTLCRAKGLEAFRGDLRGFSLPLRFDGIWANASLLHLRKAELPDAIDRLRRHLAPEGVIGCSVKEGDGERLETHERFPGVRRLFSYFSDDEFRGLFAGRFELLRFERTASSERTAFLKYLFRLRDA